MSDRYLLDENNNPYPVEDLFTWAKGFEAKKRKVAHTVVRERQQAWVSTVFLGLDHRWSEDNTSLPILFESMAFNGNWSGEMQERYATWDEAVTGHEAMVKTFRKYLNENGSRNQREGRYMDRLKKKKHG